MSDTNFNIEIIMTAKAFNKAYSVSSNRDCTRARYSFSSQSDRVFCF